MARSSPMEPETEMNGVCGAMGARDCECLHAVELRQGEIGKDQRRVEFAHRAAQPDFGLHTAPDKPHAALVQLANGELGVGGHIFDEQYAPLGDVVTSLWLAGVVFVTPARPPHCGNSVAAIGRCSVQVPEILDRGVGLTAIQGKYPNTRGLSYL